MHNEENETSTRRTGVIGGYFTLSAELNGGYLTMRLMMPVAGCLTEVCFHAGAGQWQGELHCLQIGTDVILTAEDCPVVLGRTTLAPKGIRVTRGMELEASVRCTVAPSGPTYDMGPGEVRMSARVLEDHD